MYIINGGKRLEGEIKISGSKNSVLPILTATVLSFDETVIENCPLISDTLMTLKILKHLGCKVNVEGNTVTVNSRELTTCEVPYQLVKSMRSSIIFLGSVLSRMGEVKISYPGGCELGARPIDIHLEALKQLGAEITHEDDWIVCTGNKLFGKDITLHTPSVGATQNIMLSAVYAEGTTKIINAAREPEIIDLQNFLNAMGARIYGAGTSEVIIHGVKKLLHAKHTIIPDRIIAGTYLIAAAITKGSVTVETIPEHLMSVTDKLREAGCKIQLARDKIHLDASNGISCTKIATEPYPGFPTDLQPQFTSLLSIAHGKSIVHEQIFESRYKYANELIKMGADIKIENGNTFLIHGVKKLNGTQVFANDLRGGAALILAGLAAQNRTVVHDSNNFIMRGYEAIEIDLQLLGADIKKTTE